MSGEGRPVFPRMFFDTASLWAKRSTCLRRQVGAVAVQDNRIIATGYNGALPKTPHCTTCVREEQGIPSGQRHEFCMALHAEENLVIQCAVHGTRLSGATVYTTHKPCSRCMKMLFASEVSSIRYVENYPDELSAVLISSAGKREVKKDCQGFEYWEIW